MRPFLAPKSKVHRNTLLRLATLRLRKRGLAPQWRPPRWKRLVPFVIGRIFLYLFLIVCALIFIFPFYSMFVGSFMSDTALFSRDPQFWPKKRF